MKNLGGWRTQMEGFGQVEMAVGSDEEALAAISRFFSYLPSNSVEAMQEFVILANDRAGAITSAAAQLSSSVNENSQQFSHFTEIANGAVEGANRTSEMLERLTQAVQKISDVVGIIQFIAGQTNLLALNSTIETRRCRFGSELNC